MVICMFCMQSYSASPVTPPKVFVHEELARYPLGNKRYMMVVETDGSIHVQLREFDRNPLTSKLFPTSVGIKMSPVVFSTLLKLTPSIDKCVELLTAKEHKYFRLQKKLGEGAVVSVTSLYKCVNIRMWFLPDGERLLMPTR